MNIDKEHTEASFALCDHLNPGFGYQVRIESGRTGRVILFTSRDPATGNDLLTARDCLNVIDAFVPQPVGIRQYA